MIEEMREMKDRGFLHDFQISGFHGWILPFTKIKIKMGGMSLRR